MRRAAVSIPTNIAEGCGRKGEAELGRFMQIAMGSASELQYELLLAHDLGFVSHSDYAALSQSIEEIKRMLTAFFRKLTARRGWRPLQMFAIQFGCGRRPRRAIRGAFYSERRDSTGSRRAALTAGQVPERRPITIKVMKDAKKTWVFTMR
jgi:four helix bundle protein